MEEGAEGDNSLRPSSWASGSDLSVTEIQDMCPSLALGTNQSSPYSLCNACLFRVLLLSFLAFN